MASPRRRTLCTDDGREIVPPQLPFYPSRQPTRAPPAGMTIDVHLADSDQKIRPLPRIPSTPRSAPALRQYHHQHSHSMSMRPLPSLPESGDGKDELCRFSVTPATPLPPPTPHVELTSNTNLCPPIIRVGPPRYASLSLRVDTSPDASDALAFDAASSSSPTVPEPPSPQTAQRMRNSKLRRHLGESVQVLLNDRVLPDEPPSPRTAQRNRNSKLRRHLGESVQVLLDRSDQHQLDVLARLRRPGKEKEGPQFLLETVLDIGPESDTFSDSSSDTSSDSDDGDQREEPVSDNWAAPSPPDRVVSTQKWVRERGKNRWTEDNFSQILRDLRNL